MFNAILEQAEATSKVRADPSTHAQSPKPRKLQHHAAGAALYSPQSGKQSSNSKSSYPLDKDGKLSSAGELTI
jgi:hypothetical protein